MNGSDRGTGGGKFVNEKGKKGVIVPKQGGKVGKRW